MLAKNKNTNQGININLLGILAIVLAISGPWFDLSVSNHSFVKTYIAGIGIGILVLVTLWQKAYHKELVFHISYMKLFLGLTFLLGVISIFWSVNPDFSITKLLIWVTIFMAFYVAYNIKLTEAKINTFCFLLLISAASIAIIGVLQYLFDAFAITQARKPSSTFGNRNMATQPISMVLPLAVYLILCSKTSILRVWISAIATSLCLVFIFYTSTRAALVTISTEVILISLFLIWQGRKGFKSWGSINKQRVAAIVAGLIIFFILINFNQDGFYFFQEKLDKSVGRFISAFDGKELRYEIWSVAINMIAKSPFFGTGLGTWFHNIVQEGYATNTISYVQRAHNDILEMAVSIGLIGVVIFLIGVAAIVFATWKIILTSDNKNYSWFYFILFTALSGSFVNLQFSFPYQLAMPALLFGFYIGFIARQSESIVKPIKIIKINLNNRARLYKNFILAINSIIFIVISSIYISWINLYSNLNDINANNDFDKLYLVETPIYHLEAQNIMNFMSTAYLSAKRYDVVEKIVKQMLAYWPDDYITNFRYAYVLNAQKRYNEAIKMAKRTIDIAPHSSFLANQILFDSYWRNKQYDEYEKLFYQTIPMLEREKEVNPKLFIELMFRALRTQGLIRHIPILLEKYNFYYTTRFHEKERRYECALYQVLIIYYLTIKDNDKLKEVFDNAAKHENGRCFSHINKKDPNLLNKARVRLGLDINKK